MNLRSTSIWVPVVGAPILSLASWTLINPREVYNTTEGVILHTVYHGFPLWFYTVALGPGPATGWHPVRLLLNTMLWLVVLLAFSLGWRFVRSRRPQPNRAPQRMTCGG